MAGTHATLGNDLGGFARVFRVLRLIRGGGAAATIDGLDQLQSEIEVTFDADDAHRKVLQEWLRFFANARSMCDTLVQQLTQVAIQWGFHVLRPDINSTATSFDGLIRDLAENMIIDSEDVLENVITTSAVSADSDNVEIGRAHV